MRMNMGIRKRNLVKERANTGSNVKVANRRRKGVSTIIGITIFLLIFAIAVSYTFAWTQNTGNYLQTVNQQVDLDRLKIGENLIVSAINTTALTVTNPTGNVIVVDQIWSGGQPVWSGQQGISDNYGNWTFITNATSGNGQFMVVTLRGNIFSGGLQSQLATATQRAWQVNWYYNNNASSPINPPLLPANLSSSSFVGQSYWYDLNLAWGWTAFNNPVIGGNYNMTSNVMIGFIANASVIKLSDNNSIATINCYIDSNSKVAIGIDGSVPTSWNTMANISGTQYSVHTVTVYFYGYGTSATTLKLNIVNATFAP
jgi:hypothetical protein